MAKKESLKKHSDQELVDLVTSSREAVRAERFKDKFSKDAGVIRTNKKAVARALTELNARRNQTNQ